MPSVPHIVMVGGVTQAAPSQQPLGHDVELQTQAPLTHSWPGPHMGPVPH
jgi:hypothetical protein